MALPHRAIGTGKNSGHLVGNIDASEPADSPIPIQLEYLPPKRYLTGTRLWIAGFG
jgi:hypothetical protein